MSKRTLALLLLAGCLALGVAAAGQQPPPKIDLVPVAGPVYMLEGAGGNVGVVAGEPGLLLIDAMYERLAGAVREAVKGLPGGGRVRLVVNTHWHADHTDGNKAFAPGAVVIAHKNIRALVAADQTLLSGTAKALPAGAWPEVVFEDELTLYAGGQAVRLVHFPRAHTDGDTVVFIDGVKVVHMGDMFFNGMFPFLDVGHGGDIDGWVRDLDRILAGLAPDTKIIPGHGPLAGVPELKAFRGMLAASADLVRGMMKAGKSLDEIRATGLPPDLAVWAKGFLKPSQWLELVYRSLEKNGK